MRSSSRIRMKYGLGRNLKALYLLLGVSLLIVGCNYRVDEAGDNAIPDPTTIPNSNSGGISGVIWHDQCDRSSANEGHVEGCVKTSADFYHANGLFEEGEPGIEGLMVTLGKGVCPAKGLHSVYSGSEGEYRFGELESGIYCVSVSNTVPHLAKMEPGMWTSPKTADGQGVGWTSVTVRSDMILEDVNFGWDYLNSPVPETPTPTDTPVQEPECVDHVTFIQDVTIPDGTSVGKGESFDKIWRLKNSGMCTWTAGYSLVFQSGDFNGAVNKIALSREVLPGERVDLSVELTAPETNGEYESYWMLENERGERFGIGADGDKPFWTKISVGSTPSPTSVVSWTPRFDPGEMAGEGRWVDVDLGDQTLTAYDGPDPVMTFFVSTGTAAHPTVLGQFRIWVKLESTRMTGPGYDLEDVPYTMYFYEGYGLHGAYWHNNFGTPMSHGCVNLSPTDAEWLFNFANVGTLVNIHS